MFLTTKDSAPPQSSFSARGKYARRTQSYILQTGFCNVST